jgi:hypothetical protein
LDIVSALASLFFRGTTKVPYVDVVHTGSSCYVAWAYRLKPGQTWPKWFESQIAKTPQMVFAVLHEFADNQTNYLTRTKGIKGWYHPYPL